MLVCWSMTGLATVGSAPGLGMKGHAEVGRCFFMAVNTGLSGGKCRRSSSRKNKNSGSNDTPGDFSAQRWKV